MGPLAFIDWLGRRVSQLIS